MLLPLFLSWFCNNLFVLWCMRATYERLKQMLCYVESLRSWLVLVWFEIPRDFVDYRSYMGSSLRIWSLRRLFLDLCSYNLDGSVTLCPRAKHLVVVAYRKDDHATGFKTHLIMRRTCNRGSINPEYESTPQDLTDEKGWRRLRNAGSGKIKVRFQQKSRFFCIKATNSESLRSMFYFLINH
jgi:hypothetical protein